MLFDFAIIGGDARLTYMAAYFIEKGYKVITYGIHKIDGITGYDEADSLESAVHGAAVIIAPVPLTRDGRTICASYQYEDLTLEKLMKELTSNHQFFSGCITKEMLIEGKEKQIYMYDFMKDEPLTVFNSIATAEGVIAEVIKNQVINLHQSNCMILGCGRCAKTLAVKLKGLSARVIIAARSADARSEAEALGFETLPLSEIGDTLGEMDSIFNTIPALVLDSKQLININSSALIIDIASAPGGVDFQAAKELGLDARLCLGLPGIYAPKSSAEALAECVLSMNELNK